jgi:hypothetical protein
MTINDWINEIDVKINYSLLDNTEWIKIHIDDLIELNETIKEYINNGNSD